MQTQEYCTLKKTNYEKQPYRYEGDPLRICCMHGFDMLPPPKLESARMLFSSHRDRDFSGYFWRRYFRICCVLLPSLPVYNNCATLTEDKKLSYRRETARWVMSVEICQLPRNSAETILVREVLNKSKLCSWRVTVGQCVINMCTQPWRDEVAFVVL